VIIEVWLWFGAHYNQEVRFSSAVKSKKGLRSWLRCLIKDEIIIIIINYKKSYLEVYDIHVP